MTLDHREQGETREQILALLRRHGTMTAAELSESLGIGAVGVRQHLALLDRLQGMPGVEALGLNSAVPLEGGGSESPVIKEGDPPPSTEHRERRPVPV
jgi:DNA-binding transcriptional ArsR family regulator